MFVAAEFVSEESMTKCLAMVEERAKRALRIFADLMKTSVGRAAAGAFAQVCQAAMTYLHVLLMIPMPRHGIRFM